jgi:beta-mannosidase
MKQVVIRDVDVVAWPAQDAAELDVAVAVQWLDVYKSGRGTVRVRVLSAEGKVVASDEIETLLQSGVNTLDLTLTVKNPRLWWPNGMGEQYRYTVEAEVVCGKEAVRYKPVRYGIRWIELLTEGEFTFLVNGERVYAKGGNWVPADSLYARVTDEKYRTLIAEAARANFNMFRIWGGGLYERDAFYDICDEFGIMIWHDFMLACSPYPDHLEWFRDEVAKEADFQTRRLRNHACMALWCGQNEWLYCVGSTEHGTRTDKGARLLGEVLPAAVRRNCPQTPYWYTSPSGGDKADSWEVGDCHFWAVPANPDYGVRFDPRSFDRCGALFVSEYGYHGPLCMESTLAYLDGASYDVERQHEGVWMNHFGTFDGGGYDIGLARHYIDGKQASLEEFIYFGGLLQGLMYGYSLEALRAKGPCGGSLIWMYNDAWPEVGWTLIDYYLRRKTAWWHVKRAYAPVRLIVRAVDGKVHVTLANDTLGPVKGTIEFGYLPADGSSGKLRSKQVAVDATSRKVVATFPMGDADPSRGVWLARFVDPRGSMLPSAMLWTTEFRNRPVLKPTLTVTVKPHSTNAKKGPAKNAGGEDYVLTISSDTLAHAVELLLPAGAEPDDNYIDLTPGETRRITVRSKIKLTDQNVTLRSAYDWFVNRPEAKKV